MKYSIFLIEVTVKFNSSHLIGDGYFLY